LTKRFLKKITISLNYHLQNQGVNDSARNVYDSVGVRLEELLFMTHCQ